MRSVCLTLLLVAAPLCADSYSDGFENDSAGHGIPDGWRQYIELRTHPTYNRVSLAEDPAHVHEGKRSVRLATRGGSVAIVTNVPSATMVKVDPRRGYSFSVWAMCEGLASSRAFATIQWLDQIGAPIGAEQRTDAIGGTTGWTRLVARYDSLPDQARFVRFGLHLKGSDLEGSAWFDELEWREETRIRVEDLTRHGFLVPEGGATRLRIVCEDLEDGDDEVVLAAREYDGREVPLSVTGPEEGVVPLKGAIHLGQGGGPASHSVRVTRARPLSIEYAVDGVPVGFVELSFALRKDGAEFARRRVGLVSFPRRFEVPPSTSEWGVEVSPFTATEVIDRLASLHLGRARLLLWSGSPEREAAMARDGSMDDLLYHLTRAGLQVGGSLATPPQQTLPEGCTAATMAQLLACPEGVWRPALARTFSQLRETIQEWRLGGTQDPEYSGRQDLDAVAAQIRQALKGDLPSIDVSFPLPLQDAGAATALLEKATTLRTLDLFVSGDIDAAAAKPFLATAAQRPNGVSVTFGAAELATGEEAQSFPRQAADLWKKAALAAHAGLTRLFVTPLVSDRSGLFDLEGTPTPLFAAFGVLHDAIGEKSALPGIPFPSDDDLEQLVFRHQDDTVILVWRKTPGPPVTKELYLGTDVKALRLDGRPVPLAAGDDGVARCTFTEEPVLLYDIDKPLFDTLQTVCFVPDKVDSISGPQPIELQFTNRFGQDLLVKRIAIDYPKDWKSSGGTLSKIAPGDTGKLPFKVSLPESQTLRGEPVKVRLSFAAGGKAYPDVIVTRELTVKSATEVKLDVDARWVGDELDLEVRIVNGTKDASYVIYLGLGEGLAVQSDSTPTLEKKKTWTKTYRFADHPELQGRRIRVKLIEPGATTFLSKTALIPVKPK